MNTQLIIYFIALSKNPLFKDFEIMGQKKPIKFKTIEQIKITDDFFNEDYQRMIQIKLVSEEEEIESIINLKLNKNDYNY